MALSEDQRGDLAALLAHSLSRGSIVSLAVAVLGNAALEDSGGDLDDTGTFARHVVDSLSAADRVDRAASWLMQGLHPNASMALQLSHILQGKRLSDAAARQKLLNDYQPFFNVVGIEEMFPRIRRTVCAIALGDPLNEIRGSGFLIGPDLVMTNFHVVEEFVKESPPGSGTYVENAPGNQIFCFFDYLWAPAPDVPPGTSPPGRSVFVNARQKWLEYARPSPAFEGTNQLQITVAKEYDCAVIRLQKAIGRLPASQGGGAARGWIPLPKAIDVLNGKRLILVFQHPQARPQQVAFGDYDRLDPSQTRVWYSASTAHGSSGGAAVDDKGNLFALHNAEVIEPGLKLNQGVRMDLIAEDVVPAIPELATLGAPGGDLPYWSLTDDLNDPKPVIGRTRFRDSVRSMTAPAGERVMVVTGPPGNGVQFSIKLLRRTLGVQVPVAEFNRELGRLTPAEFARTLIREIGITGRTGGPLPPQPLDTENLSRWVRKDLPRWLADQLAKDAQQHPLRYPAWVVVNTVLPEAEPRLLWAENLADCIAALAGVHDSGQQVTDLPHLRWLFLGSGVEALPVTAGRALDEDLTVDTTAAVEYAECIRLVWQTLDKKVSTGDLEPWERTGRALLAMSTGPTRKALATLVRNMVLSDGGR